MVAWRMMRTANWFLVRSFGFAVAASLMSACSSTGEGADAAEDGSAGFQTGMFHGFFWMLRGLADIFWDVDVIADANTGFTYYLAFVLGALVSPWAYFSDEVGSFWLGLVLVTIVAVGLPWVGTGTMHYAQYLSAKF